ncbi:hypothetical protein VP1G_05615 [Cytospora mali]|uniref:Cupin type-2 domain-containing protein n=1 Tax=Cytospora mali TaxID=578113 RepID=A0A194V398_CYTMA|nr:hypothetical protein VP1G_05615 [Valsa mali var. pyri (nom. inval.)]
MSGKRKSPLQYETTENGDVAIALEGAITTRPKAVAAKREFSFEVAFQLDHPRLVLLRDQKPPLHFHPYQEEYIQVLEGRLCVEMEGKEHILTKKDGEICVRPWTNHRLYPPPPTDGPSGRRTVFLLSGSVTDEPFKLDEVFFENWYAYQEQIVTHGKRVNVLQVMSMFDAGGSYLSLPQWVPFGKQLAYAMGITMGRYLGAILGYQPFYWEWTTNWEEACRKMETCLFQRRFAVRDYGSN